MNRRSAAALLSGFLSFGLLAISVNPGDARENSTRKAKKAAVPGITFAEPLYGEGSAEGMIYVPLRAAGEALGWKVTGDKKTALVNGQKFWTEGMKLLLTGHWILPVRDLEKWGAEVRYIPEENQVTVSHKGNSFQVQPGEKRVEIDLDRQQLIAYQGDLVVLKTDISSGRDSRTPTGNYTAGPYKAEMHYSSIYDNAPMPWSYQVTGDIFLHGFKYVPEYPASHGCIRLPLDNGNPARWLWHWMDRGTPIAVNG